jgi:hypothetical protein
MLFLTFFRDPNANEFDLKLKELMMHMKCQMLEVLILFKSFVYGFEKIFKQNI